MGTLPSFFRNARRFVVHLLGYPAPILRFKDVLPHHCNEYVEKLLSSNLSVGYKYHCLNVLETLSRYSRVMLDGLTIEPLKGEPAGRVVGWNLASLLESQTEIIPDEILGPLIQASLEYVDRRAGYLMDAIERIEDIRRRNKGRCRIVSLATRYLREHVPPGNGIDGGRFGKGLHSVREFNKELCYLQTACFVLIAFATGMRVSELLSLREGCWKSRPSRAKPIWSGCTAASSKCMACPRAAKRSGWADLFAPGRYTSWNGSHDKRVDKQKFGRCGCPYRHWCASFMNLVLLAATRCGTG